MRSRLPGLRGSWLPSAVLSTTAGAVDVIGFLVPGGLFTAHISGNLCVVAAHYITGGFSQVGPLHWSTRSQCYPTVTTHRSQRNVLEKHSLQRECGAAEMRRKVPMTRLSIR
jgi:hypothetical protein